MSLPPVVVCYTICREICFLAQNRLKSRYCKLLAADCPAWTAQAAGDRPEFLAYSCVAEQRGLLKQYHMMSENYAATAV
jgi:hypothetical protein